MTAPLSPNLSLHQATATAGAAHSAPGHADWLLVAVSQTHGGIVEWEGAGVWVSPVTIVWAELQRSPGRRV